ncbi:MULTISPECIES: YybH family protein [Streptomyces]|uniref:Nuclear transport factor 2 family protein n=1 Tax=Streptomyces arboris TaxID=2600619 RepID=A0A5N5ENG3_9ACTN|nr:MULTISPECIES: SgcJ/EcaC family oxidoreductase [Streptomyces]KAB2591391.1 nuclear transport factor 2 family protein [Streptomyces arboris]MDX3378343.1 SgcJ/EcaC family oxidoreductase [Streptomyces sp. ME02-6991-2A]
MDFTTALDHHLTAVRSRDLEAYMATVHDEATVILPNGRTVTGAEAVRAFHQGWFEDPDWTMETETTRTVVHRDTAVAVLDVHYRDLDGDGKPYEMRYLLSLVFARTDGNWLLVHDQNTLR